jgi:phosphoribosylformylglycinamidine synthase subunit PurS
MFPMKARVFVSPKTTVLDPQGQAIRSALHSLGYAAIVDVRQGKLFELDIADTQTREQTMLALETIAHEILANPVIEEYLVELLD